jgi:hypothetical protein
MRRDRGIAVSRPSAQRSAEAASGDAGRLSRRALTLGVLASASLAAPALSAASLRRPTQTPILTMSGKIGVFNEGSTARFDREMLEGIGMASFTTNTPWYDGPVTFEGPLMAKLMELVEAQGQIVTAVALNDYVTEIPVEDFRRYGVLLALKRDGAYMPVRDKGPLFIVYPYDTDPELRHRRFYSRSAWQVARLIVS